MDQGVAVEVELELSGLEPAHRAAENAAGEFWDEVQAENDLVVQDDGRADAGTKGWDQVLTIVLTSPVAVYSFVQLVRMWLGRDSDRSITIKINSKGSDPRRIRADGKNISNDTLQRALTEAVEVANEDKGGERRRPKQSTR